MNQKADHWFIVFMWEVFKDLSVNLYNNMLHAYQQMLKMCIRYDDLVLVCIGLYCDLFQHTPRFGQIIMVLYFEQPL